MEGNPAPILSTVALSNRPLGKLGRPGPRSNAAMPDVRASRSSYGRLPEPASGTQRVRRRRLLWLAVAVTAGALVLLAGAWGLRTVTHPVSQVEWFYTTVNVPASSGNSTTFSEFLFCPPSGSNGQALFSLAWHNNNSLNASLVRLFYLLPPSSGHPLGTPITLYLASGASRGGTSFFSGSYTNPTPCDQLWSLGENANETTTLVAVATLTYNTTVANVAGW